MTVKKLFRLAFVKERPFLEFPKECGQKFMQEALMVDADKAPLVIIKGPAGTAKTFYSLLWGFIRLWLSKIKSIGKFLV